MSEASAVVRAGAATTAFLDEVHAALEELWESEPDVGDEDRMMFTLAVVEVVTNVVTHGVTDDGASTVQVRLTAAPSLEAIIEDDGTKPDIDLTEARMPDEMAESGRGLAIALAVLDELSLQREDLNRWRLVRRRR